LDLPTGPLPVKCGQNIAIYPFITHHDANLFASPDEFQLERFLGQPVESSTVTDVKGNKVSGGYMPFGAGISMCPGRHFARNEIKLYVVTFLSLFDLEAVDAAPLQHPGYLLSRAGLGIFPPAKDVQVKYSPKA
jgi:cytochrome P450